jgi:hypothetical protein
MNIEHIDMMAEDIADLSEEESAIFTRKLLEYRSKKIKKEEKPPLPKQVKLFNWVLERDESYVRGHYEFESNNEQFEFKVVSDIVHLDGLDYGERDSEMFYTHLYLRSKTETNVDRANFFDLTFYVESKTIEEAEPLLLGVMENFNQAMNSDVMTCLRLGF